MCIYFFSYLLINIVKKKYPHFILALYFLFSGTGKPLIPTNSIVASGFLGFHLMAFFMSMGIAL